MRDAKKTVVFVVPYFSLRFCQRRRAGGVKRIPPVRYGQKAGYAALLPPYGFLRKAVFDMFCFSWRLGGKKVFTC